MNLNISIYSRIVFILFFGSFIYSDLAFAHVDEALGFVSGLLHPIYGLDHLVAMVAVGILGLLIGGKATWQLPVYFPLVMSIGGVFGIKGIFLPFAEIFIAISGIIFGSLIALSVKLPRYFALILVSFFAIFHGYAHGIELSSAAIPVSYCLGFVIGTGLLHLCGILLGFLPSNSLGLIYLRAFGGGILVVGVYYLMPWIKI